MKIKEARRIIKDLKFPITFCESENVYNEKRPIIRLNVTYSEDETREIVEALQAIVRPITNLKTKNFDLHNKQIIKTHNEKTNNNYIS